MTKPDFYNGQLKNTAEEKTSLLRNQGKMIGYKSQDLYLVGMIRNVSINLTKIRNQQYRRVTGSKEKMRSQLNLLEKMVLSSGARLLPNSMEIQVLQEMVNSAEKDG